MAEVTMPRLSDTMSEGSVGRWLKKPGDSIENGEVIAEIETDKATMELMAFESGTLQKILVPEGKVVPIGEPIALIGDGKAEDAPAPEASAATTDAQQAPKSSGAPSDGAQQAPAEEGGPESIGRNTAEAQAQVGQSTEANAQAQPAPQTEEQSNGHVEGQKVKASPLAKRMADELGVDLRRVQGTGPGGRIIKENVEEFHQSLGKAQPAAAQVPAPTAKPEPAPAQAAPQSATQAATPTQPAPAAERQPLSRMRQTIAKRMVESKAPVPHFYVSMAVQMDAAMAIRSQINAYTEKSENVKVSVNDLVVKAVALTLRKFPRFNSSFAGDALDMHSQIHVGVAVALEDGLLTVTIPDTERKPISQISRETKDLAERARTNKLRQEDMRTHSTFTVSNLGMYGVDEFTAIITPPEVAILAVGGAVSTPVVENGQVLIKTVMKVTLSTDHRVANGSEAAQFLVELKRILEQPMALLV